MQRELVRTAGRVGVIGTEGVEQGVSPGSGLVELEWNPFTTASRAARAERAGRIGEALRLYLRAGHPERAIECLHASLPRGPLRDALVGAAGEAIGLLKGVDVARVAGAPEPIVASMEQGTLATCELLWKSANRAAATARISADGLDRFAGEVGKVSAMSAALRDMRHGLATMTMADPGSNDLNVVSTQLRALANAGRSLQEELDRI